MVVDGNTFLRRARSFFKELQANRFPNAASLADECRCSRNTAQRTIYRLRDEYLVPLDYDATERGYFLVDKNYTLPALLPAGKDELAALLLARDLLRSLEARDLTAHLDSLWDQYAANNSALSRELGPLAKVFSCDLTEVGDMADRGLLSFVEWAKCGETLELTYRSPWRGGEAKTYQGRIQHVHYSDGSLYLLFYEKSGREFILNSSFIKDAKILNETIQFAPSSEGSFTAANWLDGFGVWSGKELVEIEIEILPPAAEYYAAQRWHVDQVDEFKDGILTRKLRSIVSPELVRRVLSLGSFVRSIKPESLRSEVLLQANGLLGNIAG